MLLFMLDIHYTISLPHRYENVYAVETTGYR